MHRVFHFHQGNQLKFHFRIFRINRTNCEMKKMKDNKCKIIVPVRPILEDQPARLVISTSFAFGRAILFSLINE